MLCISDRKVKIRTLDGLFYKKLLDRTTVIVCFSHVKIINTSENAVFGKPFWNK